MKSVILFVVILMLVGCSGGGTQRDTGPAQVEVERPQVALDARLAAETEKQRLETRKKRTAHELAEKKRFDAFLIEQQRQMAENAAAWAKVRAERERRQRQAELATIEAAKPKVYLPWGDGGSPSPADFGPWGNAHGLGKISFGVHEGTPWFSGKPPDRSLYSASWRNSMLDWRDIRWTGKMIGTTPAGSQVTGSATLSDFDFGGRRHRGSGWDPGKGYLTFSDLEAAGAMWGDGDLEYEVAIGRTFGGGPAPHNNSFTHPFKAYRCSPNCHNGSISMGAGVRPEGYTTTDAGVVRGMLLGSNHEWMAGTLQRDDLTAAFGGAR